MQENSESEHMYPVSCQLVHIRVLPNHLVHIRVLPLVYKRKQAPRAHRQKANKKLTTQQPGHKDKSTTTHALTDTHRLLYQVHLVLAAAAVVVVLHKSQPAVDVAAKEVHCARLRVRLLP